MTLYDDSPEDEAERRTQIAEDRIREIETLLSKSLELDHVIDFETLDEETIEGIEYPPPYEEVHPPPPPPEPRPVRQSQPVCPQRPKQFWMRTDLYEIAIRDWKRASNNWEMKLKEWEEGEKEYDEQLREWEKVKEEYDEKLREWEQAKEEHERWRAGQLPHALYGLAPF